MSGVKIRKDDLVKVIAGKDRGKEGRVLRVLPRDGRVMVDGVALSKRHVRTQGRRSTSGSQLKQGGIVDAEMFIDISNVQIVCPSCGRATRVGHRTHPDGKKVRVCRKCDTEI